LSSYTAASVSALVADIKAANLQGGANTIALTAPTTSPYVLTAVDNTTDGATGTPVIAKQDTLTIVGNGDTIERSTATGTPAFRLFDVAGGASLTLENMTLAQGLEQSAGAKGGAIYNQGSLVLSQVNVSHNTATTGFADAAGGGIWSNGSLTVENSSFNSNSAGPLTVEPGSSLSTHSGPRNAFGGGICIAAGAANITGTTFKYNSATGGSNFYYGSSAYGGAVYVASGTVTMSGDKLGPLSYFIDGNYAAAGGYYPHVGKAQGGGLCVAGGSVTLTNDQISGNAAFGQNGVQFGQGPGIFIAPGATVYLDVSTRSNTVGNTAPPIDGDHWGNYYGPPNIHGVYTALPFIGPLTASSNPVTAGSSLTLTASNISDRDLDTITQVSFFYFDSTGAKQVLGTGTQTSMGTWTLTVKDNLAPGIYSLYAQAQESDGLLGPAVALILTVQ
jgi:hypothetical protein